MVGPYFDYGGPELDHWIAAKLARPQGILLGDRARRAFASRDLGAYMAVFHHDLEYTQADGRTIDRAKLAQDVNAQLASVCAAASEFHREVLNVGHAGDATEIFEQRASYTTRALGVV